MSNDRFAFKQFEVYHDRCAMKVGTDAVLLGAWADVVQAHRVLDIGTGTGIIALMIAQRSKAHITAVDLDEDAVEQAEWNVFISPWCNRINVIRHDIRSFTVDDPFDCIVSNPPYFRDNLKSPDQKRTMARHTDSLSYRELLKSVDSLLSGDGLFSVILPFHALDSFWSAAMEFNLYPCRQMQVQTKFSSPIKRVMLELRRQYSSYTMEHLVLRDEWGRYSEAYRELTKEFYLKL
ncbi:MAG: methyltransferase [Phocaeicola sp.]|nr:methyltransferase [Phocaeicola sp.]